MGMTIMYTIIKGERVYYYEENVVIFRNVFVYAVSLRRGQCFAVNRNYSG